MWVLIVNNEDVDIVKAGESAHLEMFDANVNN